MTTIFRALGRHGRDRHQHTDRDCPLLAKAKSTTATDVESIDEERLCPYCAGDDEWNQSDDDDWSYQRAIAEQAGVDGEIVTDGGTVLACPHCDGARLRTVQHNPVGGWPEGEGSHYCKDCAEHVDPVERDPYQAGRPRNGLAKRLADAEPDDLVTDGGQDVVYVAAKSTGGSGVVVHTDPGCHQLSCARKILERPADAYPGREVCSVCRGEVASANTNPNGPWQQLEAADPDDLVTDGGVPDPDAFRLPTITELDAMRTALNLGQRELSRRADLEPSRFNHILHNDVDPHASTLRAFLDVLQDADPQTDDEIERTGPKPEPSTTAGHDPEDFELLSAKLHHSPPDAVGEDPRPPERERDSEIRTDGGERLRSKADANTGQLSVAGVVGWPTRTEEYVDLGDRLEDDGDGLPEPDRSEHDRRARQAANSLVAWASRAGLDPGLVLASVREDLPRADGGEVDHYCDICERPFETIAALIKHDCGEPDAPLVTDGGTEMHRMSHVDATEHYRQKARRLAREKALYVGVLLGGVAMFIALFIWEVLQA
jgi:transcriptional regulator with XRE-family HTH domain